MRKKVIILSLGLFLSCGFMHAQEAQTNTTQTSAEKSQPYNRERSNYIRTYENEMKQGNYQAGTEAGVKAVALYY